MTYGISNSSVFSSPYTSEWQRFATEHKGWQAVIYKLLATCTQKGEQICNPFCHGNSGD